MKKQGEEPDEFVRKMRQVPNPNLHPNLNLT